MVCFVECFNVVLKIFGIGQVGWCWSVEDNVWIVCESIVLFGVEWVMFVSNFLVDSLCGLFDDIYGGFKCIVVDLLYVDQEWFFYSNVWCIYCIVFDIVCLQQVLFDLRIFL